VLGVLLSKLIKTGTLTVIWPDGRRNTYGRGEPHATMRLKGRWTPLSIALRPDLKFGEAYMDGLLVMEDGDIATLLSILMGGSSDGPMPGWMRFLRILRRLRRRLAQYNPAHRARKNIAHHYDLSGALYDLFLDTDRQYSCAYFHDPSDRLEDAQIAKKRHIAAKLNLDRPGLKVLDIGSGWGGLALDIARDAGADVLGITLSTEQLTMARQRALAAGLAHTCRFELQDYRATTGPFDRIVSVGMFEHVGIGFYRAFFDKLRDLLAPEGVALLHTIGRADGPGATNPWINKYIFPGGYTPALSEMLPVIERSGLMVTDVEVLRLHYAETLKNWRARFVKNWDKAKALYDERFCRMWEFYLAGAEMGFRHDHLVVFQVQLGKRVDALPLTRDYMYEGERTMRFAGHKAMPHKTEAA
jgi:cyclopropane-fatty-acyl-phospholipid synthase